MDQKREHPIKVLRSVVARRHECLQKLNNGSKKTWCQKRKEAYTKHAGGINGT